MHYTLHYTPIPGIVHAWLTSVMQPSTHRGITIPLNMDAVYNQAHFMLREGGAKWRLMVC